MIAILTAQLRHMKPAEGGGVRPLTGELLGCPNRDSTFCCAEAPLDAWGWRGKF